MSQTPAESILSCKVTFVEMYYWKWLLSNHKTSIKVKAIIVFSILIGIKN